MADLLWRKRVLAAKVESTPGTAVALSGSDAAWNIYDAKINPQIDEVQLDGQGSFSPMASCFGPYMGQITFRTYLFGAASLPAWTAFLPACGFVETSRVFKPVSAPPGSSVKTMTMALYENGLVKKLRGAMGTFVINFEAGRPIYIDWTFTGVWTDPGDTSILTPTYPSETPLRFADSNLTIGAWSPRVSKMTIDIGNQVTMIEDGDSAGQDDDSGLAYACVTSRRITGSMDPQSSLVATNDIYGLWQARTEAALSMAFYSGTNTGILIGAPKLQYINVQETDRNKLLADDVKFQLNRSSSAGDDELTIEFDTT